MIIRQAGVLPKMVMGNRKGDGEQVRCTPMSGCKPMRCMPISEMHAHEMHAYKSDAYEMHAYKIHAHV